MKRALALVALLTACSGAEEPRHVASTGGSAGASGASGVPSAGAAGLGGASGTGGAGGGAPVVELPNPLGRYRCKAPPGTTGSPQTIEQAVALVNALPKPTSVACFVESLARPLGIFVTNSMFSAQPALSTKSPRVFINTGDLWTSIVIDGDASELIEFGYLIPGTLRSIKAELHLPLNAPIAPNVPYDRVRYADGVGTTCGLCHLDERLETITGVSNAFSSIAFKPRADAYVAVAQLHAEAQACSWQSEPNRCELLAAVFGGGDVAEVPFPAPMATFF